MNTLPRFVFGISTLAALSACVVAPAPYPTQPVYAPAPQPAYSSQPAYPPAPVFVDVAPPPPYQEVVPVTPFVGAVWITGYWRWHEGRHYWVPGRWEHPRPGYTYVPHRWVSEGGHWHLRGGEWVRH
jgi:hypothetical protein